jgi:formate-dependent phosphoribosylglycinamide formyltransferase (GAR transformylase)
MLEVWIVVDGEVNATGELMAASPATATMVEALRKAIAQPATTIKVFGKNHLNSLNLPKEVVFCPLTLHLPSNFDFPEKAIFKACAKVELFRYLISENFGYVTRSGNFWLPVVLTQKGPVYAEAIGPASETSSESEVELSYFQPVHFSDAMRQKLYEMAYNILKFLNASPATYLIQFGLSDKEIWFDRVFPFPAAPAIASINAQTPDLFTCHWYCLTNQPIIDLTIAPQS